MANSSNQDGDSNSPKQSLIQVLDKPLGKLVLAIPLVVLIVAIILFLFARRGGDDVGHVSDIPITNSEFHHRLELAAGPRLLQEMVNEDVDLAFARKEGVYPTDAQIQQKLDEMKKQPDYAANLKKSRETEDDLKKQIAIELAQENVITKGVTASDAEVKAFYDKNVSPDNPKALFHTPEAVQIAIIVTATEPASKDAYRRLAGGEPFATVAKSMSIDRSAADSGVLPVIVKGRMDGAKYPGLEAILFEMKVGDQLDPRKVNGNWWIIRCIGRSHESTKPFDQVKDQCVLGTKLEKGSQQNGALIQGEMKDFKSTNPVVIDRPEYKDLQQPTQH